MSTRCSRSWMKDWGITAVDYSGYDPDVSGPGGGNPFAYRVDYFSYPTFRTVTFMFEIGY